MIARVFGKMFDKNGYQFDPRRSNKVIRGHIVSTLASIQFALLDIEDYIDVVDDEECKTWVHASVRSIELARAKMQKSINIEMEAGNKYV